MSETRPADLATESGPVARAAGWLALAAAFLAGTLFAVRLLDSPDLGYHLACGEYALDHGELLRSNRWYYTELDPEVVASPSAWGPASWWDAQSGTYRFVNVNWLSQVVMAAAERAAGVPGLMTLQILLFAATLAAGIAVGLRNGAPRPVLAAAVLLGALMASSRTPLRPEGFGYLALTLQWACLAGPGFGPRRALAVTLLQVLAANVHSYFLLGIGLTGAMLLQALLDVRAGSAAAAGPAPDLAARRSRAKWLAAALGGVLVAPFANPWFHRGAWMPIETLLYMQAHGIGSSEVPSGQMIHPWAAIRELRPTFLRGIAPLTRELPNLAYLVGLAVALAALAVAFARRSWGWLLAVLAMTAASVQMNRNVAIFGLIAMPVAAVVLGGRPRRASIALAAAVVAAAALVTDSVVRQRFYLPLGGRARFGFGVSRAIVPVAPAEWINEHDPPGRVWCDYDTSSNLMWFTRPHRDMPITTGTWTFPPRQMLDAILIDVGQLPFAPFVEKYDVRTAVLSTVWKGPTPLFGSLVTDPAWVVVDVQPTYVVFVRSSGSSAALAAANERTAEAFDLAAFVAEAEAADPVVNRTLGKGAETLLALGWREPAARVYREMLRRDGNDPEAHAGIARGYLEAAAQRLGDMRAREDAGEQAAADSSRAEARTLCRQAAESAQRALELDPRVPWAAAILDQAQRAREALGPEG